MSIDIMSASLVSIWLSQGMILAVSLFRILVRSMDVAGGGVKGLVTQEDLESSRISTLFSEVGGEAMPQGVC